VKKDFWNRYVEGSIWENATGLECVVVLDSHLEGLGLGKGYELPVGKRNGVGWFTGLFKPLK
jgi:hypothetical protein